VPSGVLSPDLEALLRGRQHRSMPLKTLSVSRTVAQKGYARRRLLAPILTALVLLSGAAVLSLVPDGTRTATSLSALVALAVWLRGHHRRWNVRQWQYAWAVTGGGALWFVGTVALGIGSLVGGYSPMPGLLFAGTLATAVPWWWHHRIRPEPAPDPALETWRTLVAVPGGVLPGSVLTDFRYLTAEGQKA